MDPIIQAQLLTAIFVVLLIFNVLASIYLCYYPRHACATLQYVFTCSCFLSWYRYGCNCKDFRSLRVLENDEPETALEIIVRTCEEWWYGPKGPPDPVQYYSPPTYESHEQPLHEQQPHELPRVEITSSSSGDRAAETVVDIENHTHMV
nr:hypothetical protein [synthetic construct]AXG22157.1 hypothetical protein [synthetic construct]